MAKPAKRNRLHLKLLGTAAALVAIPGGFLIWTGNLSRAEGLAVRIAAMHLDIDVDGPIRGAVPGFLEKGDSTLIESIRLTGGPPVADGKSESPLQVTLGKNVAGILVLSSLGGTISPAQIPISSPVATATFKAGLTPGTFAIAAQVCTTGDGPFNIGPNQMRGNCSRPQLVSVWIQPAPPDAAPIIELRRQAEAKRTEAARLGRLVDELNGRIRPVQAEAATPLAEANSRRTKATWLRGQAARAGERDTHRRVTGLADVLRRAGARLSHIRTESATEAGVDLQTIDQALSRYQVDLPKLAGSLNALADQLERATDGDSVRRVAAAYTAQVVDAFSPGEAALGEEIRQLRAAVAEAEAVLGARSSETNVYVRERDYWASRARSAATHFSRSCRTIAGISLCTDLSAWVEHVEGTEAAIMADTLAAQSAFTAADSRANLAELRARLTVAEALTRHLDAEIGFLGNSARALNALADEMDGTLTPGREAEQAEASAEQETQAADLLEQTAAELVASIRPQVDQRDQTDALRRALLDQADQLEDAALSLNR